MGWSLKKVGKIAVAAVTSPKNIINPMASAYEAGDRTYKEYQKQQAEEKNREAAAVQAEINAAEEAFQSKLERRRKSGRRSNVIFAGVLGGSKNFGLGGQKSLLGL